MENSAKALYMAGSLLIALLVVSLLVYTFSRLGDVQKEKDETEFQESISKFNKEYEAYNKPIMYGVNVISCINKAVSNNEKYVNKGNWVTGIGSGNEALVQVSVKLKDLNEYISVYYIDGKRKRKRTGWRIARIT